ncbi:transposase (plasmid) [Lichenicola cladoniae]|uniref:Transposase n=1 Tax=Lichenicola cladoniae TaxID=1484109 RepID=A0A6M8HZA3_9PROT|nr:transposase [Acetobacteraceae bacterium]QKE93485.1 transposase [Lichenicola cladoniae]
MLPPRKNQHDYDGTIYKQRNLLERMFCRLKEWRRIATRFDRNGKNIMSAITLAATVIWWL